MSDGLIDTREYHPEDFPPGITVRVDVTEDDISPEEWTTERESPELFAAWRRGDVKIAVVTVTPIVDGHEMAQCADSMGAFEWGECETWETNVDMDYVIDMYPVPDMLGEVARRLGNAYARLIGGAR